MLSTLGFATKTMAIITGVGVSCSVIGAGGYVVYKHKDQIFVNYNPDVSSNEFVYIAVKESNTTITGIKDNGDLTSTINNKIVKNYQCKFSFKGKNFLDKGCTLYKLNTKTTPANAFDIASLSLGSNEITAKSTDKTNEHMVLKLSKKLYDALVKEGSFQTIAIANKDEPLNHFFDVTRQFDITKDHSETLANVKSNLFLMRIKEVENSATLPDAKSAYKCKIDTATPIDCQVYKTSTKNDLNDLTKAELSNLTAPVSGDAAEGKYLVVDFGENRYAFSELKNKDFELQTATDAASSTDTNKKIKLVPDQILFGFVSTIPSTSTIYPLVPKIETYLVSKKDGSTFTDLVPSSTKNYKCKYTKDSNVNEDNSCEIKVFPALTGSAKIHKYSDIVAQTNFTAIANGDITSKEHFLLNVDGNKLFNLNPTWSASEEVEVAITPSSGGTATTSTFTLLQKVMKNKAIGKTKLALVKYKTTESATSSVPNGKCAFNTTDTTGFECKFKKASASDSSSTAIENLSFATEDATTFAAGDHFALVTTDLKNLNEYDGQNILYHTSAESGNAKYTFDIVSLMGGDIASGKIPYFLESPTITNSTQP